MGPSDRRRFSSRYVRLAKVLLLLAALMLFLQSVWYVARAPAVSDVDDNLMMYQLPDDQHEDTGHSQAAYYMQQILQKLEAMEQQQDFFVDQQEVLIQILKEMNEHIQNTRNSEHGQLPVPGHMQDRIEQLLRESSSHRKRRKNSRPMTRLPAIPADSEDVKQVMILSYQRTGSTLLMDCLFNNNPNTYFISEPLDALYVSMYGVAPGWAVAQDISANSDGSQRFLPQHEIEAIAWLFEQIFMCNMTITSLPLEIYLHHFWYWANPARPYMLCLNDNDIGEHNVTSCRREHINDLCGFRFGESGAQTDLCLNKLWGDFLRKLGKTANLPNQPVAVDETPFIPFKKYRECVDRHSRKVEKCLPLFVNPCATRAVRALKVVRPSMDSLPQLFDKFPNLRVIHLFRDPRGVVRSRRAAWWSPGLYEQTSEDKISSAAKIYCDTVVTDYRKRKKMEERYKDRFMQVHYDEFVQDPFINTIKIYQFLNLPMAVETEGFLKQMALDKDPVAIAAKWKEELSEEDISKVKEACGEFADTLGFDWDRWS